MHIEIIKSYHYQFLFNKEEVCIFTHRHIHNRPAKSFWEKLLSVLLAGRLINGLPARDGGKWRKKQNFQLRAEKHWRISAWSSNVTIFVKINRQYICIHEGFSRETESIWYIYMFVYIYMCVCKEIYYKALSSTIEARLVWKLSIRSSGRADWKLLGRS